MGLRSLESKIPYYLSIDTLQSYSRKHGRVDSLKELMELTFLAPSSKVSAHLKNKITNSKTITGGLYAPNIPFNFVILNDNTKDYRFANFIAYGLKNYKKPLTDDARSLLNEIFTICPITSIDLCFDTPIEPNIEAYKLLDGYYRRELNTHYINKPNYYGIDKIKLYNKTFKDSLNAPVWRVEFTLPINQPLKYYEPPIDEMERVIEALTA